MIAAELSRYLSQRTSPERIDVHGYKESNPRSKDAARPIDVLVPEDWRVRNATTAPVLSSERSLWEQRAVESGHPRDS
jgi:N-glycosylase/DNA lyase